MVLSVMYECGLKTENNYKRVGCREEKEIKDGFNTSGF